MKIFQKFSAFVTALAVCSTMTIVPSSAETSSDLPDWIPQNFGEAMKFENQYGKTRIKDGLICCVQNQSSSYYTYETQDVGGTLNDLADTVFHQTYDCILPQKPDESDEIAYTAYLERIEEMGLSSYEPYIGQYEYGDMGLQYEVTVYKPTASGTIDLNWVRLRKNEEPYIKENLTFEISPEGDITETDPYGWLPDSPSECFNTPRLCGNYLVSCDVENFAYGYYTMWEQTGIGEIEEFDRYSVSVIDPFVMDLPWYHVTVYQPVTPGTIRITWNKTQSDDENYLKRTTKTYQIDDDLTIHEIEPVTIMGDVNADGMFNILDLILFQKWLLNVPDIRLDDWKAADFTGDELLNSFDFLLMKKELIHQNTQSQPMFVRITENLFWGEIQSVSVFDQFGNGYYLDTVYDRDEFYDITADTWYTELCDILRTHAPKSSLSSSFTEKVKRYINNIDQHQDCQMSEEKFYMNDYGQEKLYAIYQDKTGKPCYQMLGNFGDVCSWLECEDVQKILLDMYPALEEAMYGYY